MAVPELGRAVLADSAGRFALDDVPAGRYVVEVSAPGYRTWSATVEVPSGASLTLTLEPSPLPLDPVTVTVARRPLEAGGSPLSTSVLGSDALGRDRSVSLAHTLSRLPGVRVLSTGREIGKPVVRGLSGSRVLVLSQGLRLEDYAWSDEDGPAVDPTLVDRVEVVRGPASVLYGADAVGGVVNVLPEPLPEGSGGSFVDGEAELSAASNNRELGLVLRGEGASGPWGWRAGVTGHVAEALHTPEGELENTGFGSVAVEAAAVRRGGWGSLTARFVHHGGEFKLLEEDGPPEGGGEELEEEGPERKLQDQRLQLLGTFPLGGGRRLETRVQLQRHDIIEMEDDPAALARGEFVEVEVFDLTLETALAEALLHHSLLPGTEGTVGVTGEVQSSTTAGLIPIIPGADMASGGLFLLERAGVGPFTLLGGVRAELSGVDATGHPSRAFERITWSVGGTAGLTDQATVTGNVGTAWRAPTLFELYASGPRLGEARYEIGRPDLDPERSLNVDAGIRWRSDRARVEASVYRNDFEGFLFIQPTAEVRDGYPVFRYEQAAAVLEGVEGMAEVEAAPWLSLSARGDWVRGTNETRDEPLPLMPPPRVTLGARIHGAGAGAGIRGYLGGEVESVAAPRRLNPLDVDVEGYTLVELEAGVEGSWLGRETAVDLRVRNVGNVAYRDFLSRYKAFALDPGRDVTLRVRVAF